MTLHEAIQALLQETQRPMSTTEIAKEINTRGSYTKRDGSPITAFQIHGRTRNYPQYFERNGSTVTLTDSASAATPKATSPMIARTTKTSQQAAADQGVSAAQAPDRIAADLLSHEKFVSAGEIDSRVPGHPGLYAIRIKEQSALPNGFADLSLQRGHDLLYIGVASRSLSTRFVGQELRARGHGTFFRSLGAVLGYRPEPGSLIGKGNTRNYVFSISDEREIIAWINQNLLVNWVAVSPEDQDHLEKQLIRENLPLLNLQGNPAALPELSAVRAECVRIANTPSFM